MTYEEAVAYIDETPKFTKKNSLEHTKECLRRLGSPQDKFKVIHVAGTNGKGSTCAFLTSILREAGYSCGLFTSPHLVEINERFQINEVNIDNDTFLKAFHKVKALADELVAEGSYHPTYFEMLFLMGMLIFAEAWAWWKTGCYHCCGESGGLCDHLYQSGSYAVSGRYCGKDRRREGRDHCAGSAGDF